MFFLRGGYIAHWEVLFFNSSSVARFPPSWQNSFVQENFFQIL